MWCRRGAGADGLGSAVGAVGAVVMWVDGIHEGPVIIHWAICSAVVCQLLDGGRRAPGTTEPNAARQNKPRTAGRPRSAG